MREALCLSGGGANAGFHIGALRYLYERGANFSAIAGVSSGALNGAMLAQGKEERLFKIWETVKEAQVMKRPTFLGSRYAGIAYRCLIQKRLSIYDASPLLDFIRQEVCLSDVKKRFYTGAVSFHTGNYHSLRNDYFATNEDFQDAIYSSALMPIALGEPLSISTKKRMYKQCYDGGVKNIAPLADLIREEPGRIVIISTHANHIPHKMCYNIIDVAKRMLEIMLSEIIRNDIENLLRINEMIEQAYTWGEYYINKKTGRPYNYYEAVVINPAKGLGDPLDFSRAHIDQCIKAGYEKAKQVYLL